MRCILIVFGLLLGILVSACAGNNLSASQAARDAAFRTDQLAQLDTLACPAGVKPELWGELKAALRVIISDQSSRHAASAPDSQSSRAIMVPGTLTTIDGWHYANQGDFDQNGEVNISDLTALGANFGESSGGGPFPFLSVEAVVDGDNNGAITISDLTPLGANLGNRVTAYNIYASGIDTDVPADNGASIIGEITNVPFTDATGVPTAERLFFPYPQPDPGLQYNWVRPLDGTDGSEGIRSTVLGERLFLELSPVPPGSGTVGDPFQVLNGATHSITATLEFGGVITLDPRTTLSVNPSSAADINSDQLDVGGDNVDFTLDAAFADFPGDAFPLLGQLHLHSGPPNELPVASLDATPTSGSAPLTVDFDASGSTDSDGTIVGHEWDFENDGTVDDFTGAGLNQLQHDYTTPGQFTASVRVIDDLGGSATATIDIDVQTNQAPVADLNIGPNSGARPVKATLDASGSTDDGAITLFEWDLDGDGTFETNTGTTATFDHAFVVVGTFQIGVQVTDDLGVTSTATQQVDVTGSWTFSPVAGGPNGLNSPRLEIVNGRPAAVFTDFVAFKTLYARANDPDGFTWGGTVQPDPLTPAQFQPRLTVAAGNPGILHDGSGTLSFIRALDIDGIAWGLPATVIAVTSNGHDLAIINGNPAVVLRNSVDNLMYFQRAADALGATWSTLPVLLDGTSALGSSPSLTTIAGQPAATYWRNSDLSLNYTHGGDVDGTVWAAPVICDPDTSGTGQFSSLLEIGGRPAFASNGQATASYKRADDSGGASWPARTPLEAGFCGQPVSMALIDGLPAVAYNISNDVHFNMAHDADGNTWGQGELVFVGANEVHMKSVGGRAGIVFTETTDSDIRFALFE